MTRQIDISKPLPPRLVIRHAVPGEPIEAVISQGRISVTVAISDQAAMRHIETLVRPANANAAEKRRRGDISDMCRDSAGADLARSR